MIEVKKSYKKKADPKTKAGQLFLAQQKGLTDKQASELVGISSKNVKKTEETKTYKAFEEKYSDILQTKITLEEIAEEQVKVIKQEKDKGAKNTAIKMALDKIEPDNNVLKAGDVKIVFSSNKEG